MLYVDYNRISLESKDFVLKSVLSDSYVVEQVIECSNRAVTFLATHGVENVPNWLFLKLYDDIANCYNFLKAVDSCSCVPFGNRDAFYKKLHLATEELVRQAKLIKEQFEGKKNV